MKLKEEKQNKKKDNSYLIINTNQNLSDNLLRLFFFSLYYIRWTMEGTMTRVYICYQF